MLRYTGLDYQMGPRLRDSLLLIPSDCGRKFTQPRIYLLVEPCTRRDQPKDAWAGPETVEIFLPKGQLTRHGLSAYDPVGREYCIGYVNSSPCAYHAT